MTSIPDHVPAELVRDFNVFEFEGSSADVFEAWRRIIEEEPPVFFTPELGGSWVLNRADLVEAAWPDGELLSSADGASVSPPPPDLPRFLPIAADDPYHRALRHPLNIALSPKAVSMLASNARELAVDLIETLKPKGECDFISDFSLKMPMEIFLRIVDLPSKDREYLIGLAHDSVKNPQIDHRLAASRRMYAYLEEWIDLRSRKPGDDLISAIVGMDLDGRALTREEKLGYVALTMFGGLDTVASMMGIIAKHLAEHPDDRRRLALNPADIPKAIEEFFRRYSIATLARSLTRDAEIGGVKMKKGDRVMLPAMIHSLDESRWPDAMTVDLDRCPRDYMTFGKGTHRCPGANLARTETKIFLEEWLKRIPDFSIKDGAKIRYAAGAVAGLLELPLAWPLP